MLPNVLVVDDDDGVLEVTTEYLISLGYRVQSALSAREARALLESAPEPFDLAVVGWTLPDLPGRDLIVAIRQFFPTCAVLVTTGHSRDQVADQLELVAGVLRKPFTLRQLHGSVEQALGAGRE